MIPFFSSTAVFSLTHHHSQSDGFKGLLPIIIWCLPQVDSASSSWSSKGLPFTNKVSAYMHNLIRHCPGFELLKPSEFSLSTSRNPLGYAQHFNNLPKGNCFGRHVLGYVCVVPITVNMFLSSRNFWALQFCAQQVILHPWPHLTLSDNFAHILADFQCHSAHLCVWSMLPQRSLSYSPRLSTISLR